MRTGSTTARSWRYRWSSATAGALLVIAAGCGGSDEPAAPQTTSSEPVAMTIARAIELQPEELVLLDGYVVAVRASAPRICSALAESFPPQCGEPSLEIAGERFSLSDLDAVRRSPDRRVSWTEVPVNLVGWVRDRTLVIPPPGA